ncbi:MAG: hypothetical protein H7Y01_09510 [Ferruginibacter sp.]|nr:hypothetical protein [Chitinophagaceae bacterium]
METITSRRNWLNFVALLLVVPCAWFFCVNILNEAGINGPYNVSQPVLESLGIREQFGWNFNLLILFGPVIALLLSGLQVLHIEWNFSKEQFQFNITIRRKWFPLFIAFLSVLMLTVLFIYLAGENL